MATALQKPTSDAVYTQVKDAYNYRATNGINEQLKTRIAEALGYTKEQLLRLPAEANIGESCGNPLVIAGLSAGQVVVDLGSGGGFDCFLASEQVGTSGKVIGIDMAEVRDFFGEPGCVLMSTYI